MAGAGNKVLHIILADLVHDYVGSNDNWFVPLGVLNIAALAKTALGESVIIHTAKFISEVEELYEQGIAPDIIGTSNYIWNCNLSRLVLAEAKQRHPSVVAVMGGPNVMSDQTFMTDFFNKTSLDLYIAGPGEISFLELCRNLLSLEREEALQKTKSLAGVWGMDLEGRQAFCPAPPKVIKNLDQFPSPFSMGLANKHFAKGLNAAIESNRGCPFSCTYCAWGTDHGVSHYSTDRVKKDLKISYENGAGDVLMLCDGNFGLFERDLGIAQYIKSLKEAHGWPKKIIVNWGQVKSDRALEIARLLKGICTLRTSSQSMNQEVLKNIKRKNITDGEWHRIIDYCKEQGVESFGELIAMLPGETFASYVDGLRYLLDLDVDYINSNQLQLLNGSALNSSYSREKYGLKTRWRLLENCYGMYYGTPAIEAEEIVVETMTLSIEENYKCRMLNWLLQMSWTLRRHRPFLMYLKTLGVNPIDFLLRVIEFSSMASQNIRDLLTRFDKDARDELFSSIEDLKAFYSRPEQMELLRHGEFRKLNTYYSGVSFDYNSEIVSYYNLVADRMAQELKLPGYDFAVTKECANFTENLSLTVSEIESLARGQAVDKVLTYSRDYLAFAQRSQTAANQGSGSYKFFTDAAQVAALRYHVEKFSTVSKEYWVRKLNEPYFGIDKKHLLFRVERV